MMEDSEGLISFELDMLEDRQDLSQYSYDPEDRLETVTFPDSQQSSQASDKTDVFLGVFDDQEQKPADGFEDDLCGLNFIIDAPSSMPDDPAETGEYLNHWLATAEEPANQVSTSQEVPSDLSWEDASQHTLDIEVFKYTHFVSSLLL